MNNIRYKSQFGQDKYIIEQLFNFKKNGYFIEIGTGDGIHISNTYTFEKYLNWDGICVECNPYIIEKLKRNRKCIIETSPVTDLQKEVIFNAIPDIGYYNSYFSSIYSVSDSYINDVKKIKLVSMTLSQLFNKYDCPSIIDYLSIDTEGGEFEILKSYFDLNNNKHRINVISIEHNFDQEKRKSIKEYLEFNDYKFVKQLEVDDIFML